MLLQREIGGHSRPHSLVIIPGSCQGCLPVAGSPLRSDLPAFFRSAVKGLPTIISISTRMDFSFNLERCQLQVVPRLLRRRQLPEQLEDEIPLRNPFRCCVSEG